MDETPHLYGDMFIEVEPADVKEAFPVEDTYVPTDHSDSFISPDLTLGIHAFFNPERWDYFAIRINFLKDILNLAKQTWTRGHDVLLQFPDNEGAYHTAKVEGLTTIDYPEDNQTYLTIFFKLFRNFINNSDN